MYGVAAIRNKERAALTCAQRGTKGQTTEPADVDDFLTRKCKHIFEDPELDEAKALQDVLRISHADGPEKQPFQLGPPQETALMEMMAHTNTSSAHPFDNRNALELKLCPLGASQWPATTYNLIEEGHRWPDTASHANAFGHLKPKPDPTDQISSRIPVITSAMYKLWAGTCVRQLRPWMLTWAPDELFSRVPSKGSFDAAYTAVAEAEAAERHKDDVKGIPFDLSKAFENTPRTTIYAAAIELGVPPKVLLAFHN